MQVKRGFTLVEILIVVVILGILAAIVVPQFTQASTEAKENSLRSNLQSLRSQIELYKSQHNDVAPAPVGDNPETWVQLTQTTDTAGAASGSKARDAAHNLGPYLERVPNNPFTGTNTVTVVANEAARLADGASGWSYVLLTGEIFANHGGQTALGEPYNEF